VTREARYYITSSYTRILAREMRLQERELPRLLQGTGLPRQVLLPGDETRLSGAQQLQIISNARHIDSSPELGLRLGRQLTPFAHGPIGYLVLSSPDLITALKALQEFLPLRIAIAELGLEQTGDWLQCTLSIRIPAPEDAERMLLECFALLLQSLVESVLGEAASGARFEFAYEAPKYRDLYPEYFQSPTLFCREQNRVLLPAALAQRQNTAGDSVSYGLARALCQRLLNQVPGAPRSMTEQVRRLLLSMPPETACEETVARSLFITKRTLARRLEKEGSKYRDIRERLFAELAARHLRESELSVEAIAALLGYHDSANFRRAFRRWHGTSPGEFRRNLDAGGVTDFGTS
jgi:AraC-like DNA-binding protein